MPTRVLILKLEHPTLATDHLTADIGGDISVGDDAAGAFVDSFRATIALTNGGGVYKTDAEFREAIAAAAKAFILSAYGIPIDGYGATYIV
jgi:hypothetical protein